MHREIDYTGRVQVYSVDKLMAEARRLAVEYRRATGRPLAIGGEIGKHDAIRLLGLEPAPPDAVGCDALGKGARDGLRYQIKSRAMFEGKTGQRIGHINLAQQWDRVLLVLFDAEFLPYEIHEATREHLLEAYDAAGRRSGRGPLSVARFKHIARRVWSAELGVIDDGASENSSSHVRSS